MSDELDKLNRRDFIKSPFLVLPLVPEVERINRKIEKGISKLKKFNHIKILSLEEGFWFRTDNNVEEDTTHISLGNPHNVDKRFSKDNLQDFMRRASRTNYSNYVFHQNNLFSLSFTCFPCKKMLFSLRVHMSFELPERILKSYY